MSEKEILFNGVLKREKQDPRDYRIARFIPNIDMTDKKEFCLDLPNDINITMNQNWFSACVGFAYSTAISVLTYQKTHKWITFDPFMIYGTRKEGGYTGKGMYIEDAADTVYKEGAYIDGNFKTKQEVPQLIESVKEFKKNHPDLVEYAKTFCIEGYSRVDTVDEIKASLIHGMPVIVSYSIKDSFYRPRSNGYVDFPQTGEYRGCHCMLIVGWTSDKRWIVLNSWGTSSGGHGALYISFAEPINDALSISDTIIPIKHKYKKVILNIDSNIYQYFDENNESNEKEMDVAPFIDKNNRTLVPVRFVAEALGASVEWIAEENTAILRSEEAIIKLNTQNNIMYVDNDKVRMDTKPQIVNNRMFVPIRYIAENLNCDVKWDKETSTAIIIAK